jgi:hypothetical protein
MSYEGKRPNPNLKSVTKLTEQLADRLQDFYDGLSTGKTQISKYPYVDEFALQLQFGEVCENDFSDLVAQLLWDRAATGNYIQKCHDNLMDTAKQIDELSHEIKEKGIPLDDNRVTFKGDFTLTGLWLKFYAGLSLFIDQLRLVTKISSKAETGKTGETEQETTLVKKPLSVLKNPVTCVEISGIIRRRSDNIAAKLKKSGYPVVKSNRRYYCDAEHAGVLWPKWKKHWQNKQNQ